MQAAGQSSARSCCHLQTIPLIELSRTVLWLDVSLVDDLVSSLFTRRRARHLTFMAACSYVWPSTVQTGWRIRLDEIGQTNAGRFVIPKVDEMIQIKDFVHWYGGLTTFHNCRSCSRVEHTELARDSVANVLVLLKPPICYFF